MRGSEVHRRKRDVYLLWSAATRAPYGYAVELHLCSTDGDFEVDKDGYISKLTYSTESTLLKVNCKYLTVEQFADLHSVSLATVHKWICSGKLRHAKKLVKIGSFYQWKISHQLIMNRLSTL